jgi:hypothetical protein
METAVWFITTSVGHSVIVSCAREKTRLIHDRDSLKWAEELVDMFGEAERLHVVVDLASMDYISLIAVQALSNLDSLLAERFGTLRIRGVQPHVLSALLIVDPRLDAGTAPVERSALPVDRASAA